MIYFKVFFQGISTAASDTKLAQNIDQQHIEEVKETTTINNGTTIANAAKISRILSSEANKLRTTAKLNYDLNDIDYYSFDIGIKNKVRWLD